MYTSIMEKLVVILLLVPLLSFGQYKRHYKEPKKLSIGTSLVIGGVIFTAAPIISEVTSNPTPFKYNSNQRGIQLTPNKMALFSGISVTIVGLITLIAEN
jgi:hypothetical protein